jgi:hypothetical protein
MRTIETTATVAHDGTLTVQVPLDVMPGTHRMVLVIDESHETQERQPDAFPVVSVRAWPSGLSLRREDMDGDAGH